MAASIAAQTAVVAKATQATRASRTQRVQACAGFKAAPLAQKQQTLKSAVAQRVASVQVGAGRGLRAGGSRGGRLGPIRASPARTNVDPGRLAKRIALAVAAAGRWLPGGGGDGQEVG